MATLTMKVRIAGQIPTELANRILNSDELPEYAVEAIYPAALLGDGPIVVMAVRFKGQYFTSEQTRIITTDVDIDLRH